VNKNKLVLYLGTEVKTDSNTSLAWLDSGVINKQTQL